MLKNLKKENKGFTIIEVLIVLAIAGLIMLVVFLAVPALQRNSRNTSYRSEAAQLLSAASEHSSNNNGNVPVAADSTVIVGLTKNKTITSLTITSGAAATTPTFSSATLRTGVRCGTLDGTASHTPVVSSTRSVVLIYAIENSSGAVVAQCQES